VTGGGQAHRLRQGSGGPPKLDAKAEAGPYQSGSNEGPAAAVRHGAIGDGAIGRDRRAAAAIGRHARLDLVFGYRRGRTVLTRAYAEPPFKIGRPVEAGGAASLIIVCAAPGVFPGDELRQAIRVQAGARVALRSQSALQAHPGAGAAARLDARYEVDAGAELSCVWDPLIPFPEAKISQRIEIALAQDSRFYWSDAMLTGRSARGEAWMIGMLGHELRLSIDGALQYLERYWLVPQERDLAARWVAGAASHLSTILVHDPAPGVTAEMLQHRLDVIEDVQAGFDTIAPHLIVGRMLASRGPAFAAARRSVEAFVEFAPYQQL
jgi:urease accessory protein UreH